MAVDLSELKRLSFPATVSYGLRKLEEVLKLPQNSHLHNTQQHIIDDYILCYRDVNTSKPKILGAVEGLVMVREVGDYLAQVVDPGTRNILFITLFQPGISDPRTQQRLHILATLISLAVATHNVSVLEASAVWMQQVCCLSKWSVDVCRGLVQDYFQSSVNAPPHFTHALRALPSATPLFTANLITSIAELYAKIDRPNGEWCDRPPQPLVEMIVWWLTNNTTLALAPLTHSLPGISLPMTVVPPITPLIKWCVEAPFFETDDVKPKLSAKDDVSIPKSSQDLYSELHLAILHTLQAVPTLRPQMTQRQVLCSKQMYGIVDGVNRRIQQSNGSSTVIQTSLNRLAQIIFIALKTESLTGNLEDMWRALHRLPSHNRLIKTLLASPRT